MDAKAEAEKRYPYGDADDDPGVIAADRTNFLAGAAWALREFGDMLDVEAAREAERTSCAPAYLAPFSWAAEAHRIADGIEEVT